MKFDERSVLPCKAESANLGKEEIVYATRSVGCASYRNDLQGIRAIAITSVLLFHYYPSLFSNGYVGVDQFFVLSGYLMSMVTEQEKKFGIREIAYFYYRRAKRILPSYLLMIILSLTCSRFLFSDYIQVSNLESAKYALLFTTNIQAADSVRNYETMLSKATDLFTHTWSIAVEMQFYAIFPAIMVIFKMLPLWIAMTTLKLLVSLSILCHVILPPTVAFNFTHARIWQFVFGIYVHQLSRQTTNPDPETSRKYMNLTNYGFCLAAIIGTNLLPFMTMNSLILRIITTLLTGGLIFLHPPNEANFMSSKYFTYVGHISYSLYLVHWPIYIIFWQYNFRDTVGLSCGLILSILVAVVLTETFEKLYLQAGVRTVLCLIVCLYAVNLLLIDKQKKHDLLEQELESAVNLFTPVCLSKNMNTNCDIPFSATKLGIEQVLRLNTLFTMSDVQLLSYKECSYRRGWHIPWGYCDLPSESRNPARKIMVIGNSYAANQARLVYEMCHSSDVDVQVFAMGGCNVLTIDRQYHHCWKSHSVFNKVVREYKPNVLFVLSRYTDMFDVPETNTTSETENIVKEAVSSLRKLSRTVTDHIFVLNAIPRPHFAFEYNHEHSLREHRPIEPTELLNVTGLEVARRRVAESVATCSKCSIIDYTPTFTLNNTFRLFDAHSNVAYMNELILEVARSTNYALPSIATSFIPRPTMEHRSKSVPSNKTDTHVTIRRTHNPSRKPRQHVKSALDNRPEWNNDTKIEGYEDVDENGRYRRRGVELNRAKTKAEQEELNQAWLNSLRSDFEGRRRPVSQDSD
ncbi:hypothetical protein RB195_004810 [Necator americanus]|uniref:Acyltransferase n=3 Tax=Necator americanus TaxID=51031 RepID=A0ABR1BP56_NECAM